MREDRVEQGQLGLEEVKAVRYVCDCRLSMDFRDGEVRGETTYHNGHSDRLRVDFRTARGADDEC